MWRVGVKSTGYAGGLCLFFFHGGRRVDAMCGGQQWRCLLSNILAALQEMARPSTTHALADTGVHLFNADSLILSWTSVGRRISQTAHPS